MAQAAYGKRATVSDLLRSLTKNEQMSELLVFWANHSFADFFAKNKQFAQKIDERILNSGARVVVWCVVK